MKQWKRLAALSSAIVMAAATLTYFPSDTLQNIRLEISASAETTTEPQVWNEDNLTWTLDADGKLTISGTGAMKDYNAAENLSPAYMNSDVKKVVIEDGVTSIGELAFYKCSSLTNITIPDSVTCIEYAAFHGCSSLSSITIPNSVTSIGIYAFVFCSSLTSITIPDGVTSIGYGAFSECSSLKTISLSCKSSLKKSDFGEQANLVSYTNQHLLTKTAAKAATCAESGNKEYWTCEHCGKYFLSDDTDPETATAVEQAETILPAIQHKNAITRGVAEPTETAPGYSGDLYCPDCDTVLEKGYTYWKEDNLTWTLYADGTLNISGTGAMKDYDYYDNPSPVYNNWNVKKVVIEDGVTSIGNVAFFCCGSLTSITIPDSVTSIGAYAFYGCRSLTSITIPDSVTSIEEAMFFDCKSLTSITIPDGVTSIGMTAFYGCRSLTNITIPDSITSIGNEALYNCSSLKTISLSCKSSLKRSDFGEQADLVSASHTLKKTEAKAATCTENGNKEYWTCEHCGKYFLSDDTNSETATAVELSETILPALNHKNAIIRDASEPTETSPGYSGDLYCPDCDKVLEKGYTYWVEDNLTWKLYEDGTLNISGKGAMKNYDREGDNPSPVYNNLSVKKVVIEDGVTSIGDAAFYDCNNLTSITIPDSVTSIGKSAFYKCSSLTAISLSCKSSLKKSDFGEQADLVSYTNQHTLTKTEAKAATCTEKGNKEYWTCEHCKKYFLSDDTNPETAKAVEQSEFIIPALNHKNAIIQNASEPTETAPGYSGDRYCPDCDTVFEKGHTYWNEDNLTWKLYEDGTLNISGKGAMKDYNSDDNPSPASQKKDSVKKVVIEDGVTSIGDSAFSYCSSLTNITIPDSVTSIGDSAFSGCWDLTSITIPDSITTIGESAFSGCSGLTSITIPNSVTSIGAYAFSGCRSLTSITIPDSVTSIGNSSFSYCISLTSITIPNSVTSIGTYAFSNCWYLTSITIPDSVTSIGKSAFYKCSSLTTISLSCKSTLKKSDFGGQADLVSYTNEHTLTKTEAKAATCTENGNKEYWTCEHCGKYFLSDDTNPATAKAVELSETILPAIQHKNAELLNASEPTETAPGYSGDRYCPDCDKVVEKGYTYWNEGNLTWKLYEDGTLTISGTGAMKDYNADDNLSPAYNNSDVKKIVIEDGVTSIGDAAFYGCSSLTSITIPDGVTSIGESAFSDCSSLTSITIPDSVTSIGNNAFDSCSSLTSITIPDGVTSIEGSAFYNCSGLTSITIPDSVTSIESYAFCNCSNLTSITIPDSVTSIGESVFDNCTNLTTISLSCKSTLKRSDFGDQTDLVSYTLHTLKKTEAKAATCTENGNKEYWTCEHCGKYFLSDDANPETAKAVELSETVIPALVQIATTTTPIKCVYGQDMNKIDMRDYVKNTDVVGEVTVKVATGSTLPDGMKLDNGKISGKPAKAYEDGKEVTFTFTAENGNTANLTLLFLVAKADPTVEVAVSGDSHTEGDLVSELKLILSENSTKGVVELVSEIKALVAGKNTLTWKFTPEDENNYHTVTGTVVVNAQTTTTTTTKATTTTTKATTTTKPSKTTTTKATTTTKPSKTTTTNATTTTKPSKTTTTKVTTTTKPSKTTTTNATTTNTAIPSYGDVNLDGKVDIVDAIFLNKYLATLIQFSDAQMANADCCQDGVLNDQDTTALMQFIILLIDDLPVQPIEK